jgi:hypothetical protein
LRSKHDDGAESEVHAESHFPALVTLLAVGGLYAALPFALVGGAERWILLCVVGALLLPTIIARARGRHSLNQTFGYILNGVVTVALIWSVAVLVKAMFGRVASGAQLLFSTIAIWISNVLVFASWYWRLDAGGPHERDLKPGHDRGAFLFAQMQMEPEAKMIAGEERWSPNFVDYLFLAFHTSTAFSPTDAPVLSRWAKMLMMIQTSISLLILTFLAARAFDLL